MIRRQPSSYTAADTQLRYIGAKLGKSNALLITYVFADKRSVILLGAVLSSSSFLLHFLYIRLSIRTETNTIVR